LRGPIRAAVAGVHDGAAVADDPAVVFIGELHGEGGQGAQCVAWGPCFAAVLCGDQCAHRPAGPARVCIDKRHARQCVRRAGRLRRPHLRASGGAEDEEG